MLDSIIVLGDCKRFHGFVLSYSYDDKMGELVLNDDFEKICGLW